MPIRVAVLGAGGRMGQTVCAAIEAEPGLDLVSRIDPQAGIEGTLDGVDVTVDFTSPSAVRGNVERALGAGCHAVVGTTGWSRADLPFYEKACADTGGHLLLAPNFAIGAVLMMRLAVLAAPYFERAEIIELHHDGKADAPSGTARLTAELIEREWPKRGDSEELVAGSRGGLVGQVRVHSVRLPGLVANQEVLFGTTGQTLTIRHDTTDRTSFMPGVLLAVRKIGEHPGLTVGLEHYLGI
jgi:4-hydroxy-tetrahydrodipicolinate reductase